MALSIMETKNLFASVRSGLFRTLRETDTYSANGFFPDPTGVAAESAAGFDADYEHGLTDVGAPGDGDYAHNGNFFIKRAVAAPLGTLSVHTDFTEGGATAYEEIVLGADGSYALNITGAGYVETALGSSSVVNMGFPIFTNTLLYDGLTVVTAFSSNGASLGAHIRLQFTTAKTLNRVAMFMSGAGNTGVYKVEASTNRTQWVTLGSNYIPALAGYNNFDFINNTAYKYYRLVLTGRTLAAEITTCTEMKVFETDQCFLIDGIDVFDLSKMNDGNFVNTAFDTNGMPAGAYVGFKMSAAQKINKISLYMSGAGYTSTFTVKASADMITFDTLGAAFAPVLAGWNAFEFVNDTAYKYYILELDTDVAVETETCTEFKAEYTGKFFTYSGLTSFDGALIHDGLTVVAAVDVNGAAANSWFTLTLDTATVLNQISFFMSGAGHTSTYKIQGSNNNVAWTQLVAAFAPVNANWNVSTFANAAAYKYYRFVLNTNLPVEVTTINEIKLERQYICKYTSDVTSSKAGATCLGIVKSHDDAADYVLTHDISLTPVDLSGVDRVYFWAKSDVNEVGAATVTISQGANDYTTIIDITNAAFVQEFYIDLSAVADIAKNAIDTITITIGMASENKRIWFDGLIGSYYGVVELEIPGMVPSDTYLVKVLRLSDMTGGPPAEGDVYVQVSGDGSVWELPIDVTASEVVTDMLVPASEYDLVNGTGTFLKYTRGNVLYFTDTFANDYGVSTTTHVRILFTGDVVVLAGVILEKL